MHDKEMLLIKYDLVKFRVHLLGTEPSVVYTDHGSRIAADRDKYTAPLTKDGEMTVILL